MSVLLKICEYLDCNIDDICDAMRSRPEEVKFYRKKGKMMNIREIETLAIKYRMALDKAFQSGAFGQEYPFSRFPRECCDDVCDLFGQMLFERGVTVFKVSGIYRYDNAPHMPYYSVSPVDYR